MAQDVPATAVDGSTRRPLGKAEWRVVMADFERWNGSQASFCEARGVSLTTFQSWRRRLGLTAGAAAGKSGGFVEIAAASGAVWDVELSLGDGVVLRLRRG